MNIDVPARAMTPVMPAPQQGLDFKRLFAMLRRRLPLVIAMVILFGSLGFGAFSLAPQEFRATSLLLIEPRRANAVGPEAGFAAVSVDQMKIASVVSVIESSVLLMRVVRGENLADDPEFGFRRPGLADWLRSALPGIFGQPVVSQESRDMREQRAVARLAQLTRVLRTGFNYVVRVDVTASTGVKAQRLANGISEAFLTDQLETKLDAARRASTWFAERLAELRTQLITSETEVERIRRDFNLTETDRGGGSTLQRQTLTELNTQLGQVQAELSQRQARFELAQRIARGGNIEALPEVVASGVISSLRGQQADVQRRLGDVTQRLGPRHPDVLRVEEERRAVERQIGGEVSRLISNIRNEYESMLSQRRQVQERISQLTVETSGTVSTGGVVQLREAQRVAEASRQLYDTFLNRAKEAETQQGLQEAEARIITPAVAPGSPNFPQLPWFVGLPLLAGLGVGCGLALLFGSMENWIVTVSDVENGLGIPVLATVPMLRGAETRTMGQRGDIIDYAASKPLSRFSEGLRAARVGIQLSNVDIQPKVVHFTSAVPGEGKSTLAASFAVSTAAAGRRVLLIDCDLRHPSASKLFGISNAQGLMGVLTGEHGEEEAKHRFRDSNLWIMPTGSVVKNPSEIIGSDRFRDLVNRMHDQYDLVVLDSPPLLAVSDARLIADLAQTSVLVVEWRSTPRDLAQQAIAILRQSNATIAGAILNKVDLQKLRLYGYGYGDGYGYGSARYYRAVKKYYSN